MNYYLFALFSFSIIIAAGIGIYRFKKIDPSFHPFIVYTIVASLNEICSYVITKYFGKTNTLNNNVFVLLAAIILIEQFHRWNLFRKKKITYFFMQAIIIITWFSEWYALESIKTIFHNYRFVAAAMLILLGLSYLNKIIFSNIRILSTNAAFLICIGIITLQSFKIFTELFWLLGSKGNNVFLYKVYEWFGYINLIINLLFILAVLWIPKKPRYTTFTL